jgi:hypothetical protein
MGGRFEVDPCHEGGGTSEGGGEESGGEVDGGEEGGRITISLPTEAIIGCFVSVLTMRRRLRHFLKHLVTLEGLIINIITRQMITKKRMIKGMSKNIAQSFPPLSDLWGCWQVKLSGRNPKVVVSDILYQKNGIRVSVLESDPFISLATNLVFPSN